MAAAGSNRRIRTGLYDIDLGCLELRKDGVRVPLQEQPFQVLSLLLERPGEVVTREELQTKLWPANAYCGFDEGINTAIRKLRLAFGDSADNPRFIETLPRRGYRFIAQVSEVVAEAPVVNGKAGDRAAASEGDGTGVVTPATPAPAARVWKVAVASAVVLLTLASGFYPLRRRPTAKIPPAKPAVLAVLPFQNLSNDPEQDYFSDGLTEETISDVGQLSPDQLGVIARTSAMAYKHTTKTIREIGRELGVDYILEGSVRREGKRVRISAQLIRVRDQTHLWAENYDREFEDFLGVQNDIGYAISRQVDLRLTPEKQSELETVRKVDPEAYDLYLKGLFYWNTLTATGVRKAISYFEQSTRKDPSNALAYAGLADCYALLPMIGDAAPRESFPAAEIAIERALELNDALAVVHDSNARVKLFYEWDWPQCEKQCLRAIALNRNLAGAHVRYAHLLSNLGRHQEALAEAQRARQLDPLSLITNALEGMFLLHARRYDAAIQQLQRTVDINPHFFVSHFQLGKAYEQKKMYADAIAELAKAREISGGNTETIASLGHAYAVSGQQGAAREVLAGLERQSLQSYVPAFNLALVYAGLGEEDRALEALERGYEERDVHMMFLKVDPRWDDFRADPRFVEVMRRMRLEY